MMAKDFLQLEVKTIYGITSGRQCFFKVFDFRLDCC